MKIKKNKIPEAITLLRDQYIKKGLTMSAELVLSESTRIVPVLTGRLRSSLNYKVNENWATVGTNVVYAAKIEFGGSKKAPEGYLRPALYKNEDNIQNIFSTLCKGLEGL